MEKVISGITTEIVSKVTGYDRGTASRVLRAMAASNKAKVIGSRNHWEEGRGGAWIRLGGRPLTVYEAETEALKAFFNEAQARDIVKESVVANRLEREHGAKDNSKMGAKVESPTNSSDPKSGSAAPYGYRKDGQPKARPGRKPGSKVGSGRTKGPGMAQILASLVDTVKSLEAKLAGGK